MKKKLILTVGVLLSLAAAFVAGAEAEKAKKKFPWASEAMNEPEGLTRIEVACLKASYTYRIWVHDARLDVVRLLVEPTSKGIAVISEIAPGPDKRDPAKTAISSINTKVMEQVRDRLSFKPADNFPMAARLYVGSKLIGEDQWRPKRVN